MELVEKKVIEYINEVDSSSPTPGGGSVAALVGALGVALVKMLAHLSVDKKKFKLASSKEQEKFILATKELEYYKNSLKEGIDDDAISYKAVIAAYQSKDENEIQNALLSSAFVALEIQLSTFKAIKNVEKLIALGNKNVMSDLVSGAILLAACCEMSAMNVRCNANLLKDESKKEYYLNESAKALKATKNYKNKIVRQTKIN